MDVGVYTFTEWTGGESARITFCASAHVGSFFTLIFCILHFTHGNVIFDILNSHAFQKYSLCYIYADQNKLAKLRRHASRVSFGSKKFGPNLPTPVTNSLNKLDFHVHVMSMSK